ncbi:MAG: ABC transporter ATPase [Tenacibaculum sp.]
MHVEYKNLAANSKVWIYQSDRAFSNLEVKEISKKAQAFTENWTCHSASLKASFLIKYKQFLVFAVDESFEPVSGCSIDASVKFIKQLEAEFNISLTDRMNIAFKDDMGINIVKLADFKKLVKDKKITPATVVFNNMANTKSDFETQWEVIAENSWHKRFLA